MAIPADPAPFTTTLQFSFCLPTTFKALMMPASTKMAVLYAIAYLFEHREEADHHALTLSLRSLLFGVRKEGF